MAQAVTNVISQVEQQDAVQLELRGDTLPQGASCVVSGEEFDLTHLQSFLDRIVQSNTAVKTDSRLVFTVQLCGSTDDARTLSKFATDSPRRQKTVFLFLFEKHYYGITSMKSFLGSPYVCEYCYVGYTSVACHYCEGHCSVCSDSSCSERELRPVVCVDCNRTCRSASCLAKHKEPVKRPVAEKYVSNCELIKRCKKCDILYYIAMNEKVTSTKRPHDTCPLTGRPFDELHASTVARIQTLESVNGLKVNVMREHDWLELKKSHPPLRDFLKRAKTPRPLSPRDALNGGRTSAARLRYTAAANETVQYVDVTSLYPYVNCAFPYPLGHPEIVY
ncbi:hypothetical protein ABVT39_011957 [Epinephelus coioides]